MAAWDNAPSPDSAEGKSLLVNPGAGMAAAPTPESPAGMALLESTAPPPKSASSLWESIVAGAQGSVSGLTYRQQVPEYQLDPAVTPWYNRAAGNIVGLAGDLPAMVPAFLGGSIAGTAAAAPLGVGAPIAGLIAGGTAAGVAPAVIREALMDHFSGKDVDMWKLLQVAGKETIIGVATFGAGGKVAKAIPGLSNLGALSASIAEKTGTKAYLAARGAAIAGAEVVTMTGTRGVLEARIPEGHEFIDAAIVIGGIRGIHATVSKAQEVYRKTGVPPERIAQDAKVDPTVRFDMLDETRELPRAYEPLIEIKSDPIVEPPPVRPAPNPKTVQAVTEERAVAEKADTTQAIEQAKASNTFRYQEGDTSQGYGSRVGYPQKAGTPAEKLFSNFADVKKDAASLDRFRGGMLERAKADPAAFPNDPVYSTSELTPDGLVLTVDAAKAGGTRVTISDGEKVVAAARINKGLLDSIAVDKGHAGRDLGFNLLKYLDDNKLANVLEVPDRSPGFVAMQRRLLKEKAAEEPKKGTAEPKAEKAPEEPGPKFDGQGELFGPPDPAMFSFMEKPFKDVPADGRLPIGTEGKNLNLGYVTDQADASKLLAAYVDANQRRLLEAKGGTVSEAQMAEQAAVWLKEALGKGALVDAMDPKRTISVGEVLARRDLTLAAATEASNVAKRLGAQLASGVPLSVEQMREAVLAMNQVNLKVGAFTQVSAESGRIQRALQIRTPEEKAALRVAKAMAEADLRSPEEVNAANAAKTVAKGKETLAAKEEALKAVEEIDPAKNPAKEAADVTRNVADTVKDIAKKVRKGGNAKVLTEEQLKAKEEALAKKKEDAAIKAKVEKLKRDRAEETRLTKLREELETGTPAERADILARELERTKAIEKALKGTEKETELGQMLDNVSESIRELRRSINENVPKAEKDAAMRRAIDEHGATGVLETFNKLYGEAGRGLPTAADAADVSAIRRLTKERDQLAELQRKLVDATDAERATVLDEYAQSREGLLRTLMAAGKETERTTIVSKLKEETAALKKALKDDISDAEEKAAIMREVNRQGGAKLLENFVLMVSQMDTLSEIVKMAKPMSAMEKVLYVWKAGLVSGFYTMGINLTGNASMVGLRIPTSVLKATLGMLRTGEDRVLFRELVGELYGLGAGLKVGLAAAGRVLTYMDPINIKKTSAGEGYHTGTPFGGVAGKVVEAPFRLLEAGDLIFRSMNEAATMYAEAYRRAINRDGLDGNLHQNALKYLKDEDILAHAETSGKRATFTEDLGKGGQALQGFLREIPALQFAFPFVRTTTNMFKETGKYIPAVNFLMREQREAYRAGGEARDAIRAQMLVGGAVMGLIWSLMEDDIITGAGHPDPQIRATQENVGFKPYRIFGADYSQIPVLGSLIGLVADFHTVRKYMTEDETEHASKMVWYAFNQQVINKNVTQGAVKLAAAVSNPYLKGQAFVDQLAASFIPGIIAQPSAAFDGYVRESKGILEAISNRIYGLRQNQPLKLDLWGNPIPLDDHIWRVLPIKVAQVTDDPLRLNAARIGFATPLPPRKVDAVPGSLREDVTRTKEEQDIFTAGAGKMAYDRLKPIFDDPDLQLKYNDVELKKMLTDTFAAARRAMRNQILEPHREKAVAKALEEFNKDRSLPGFKRSKQVDRSTQ